MKLDPVEKGILSFQGAQRRLEEPSVSRHTALKEQVMDQSGP